MGLFDLTSPAEALEDHYQRERAAILSGRFDVLERLGAEKERLIKAVARSGSGDPALARIRRRVEQNGLLLRAMESGVRSAARRLEAIKTGASPLQTYDSAGQKTTMPAQATQLHRRA